eukprot:2377770-Rhodomonas_salina.9
MRRRQPWAGASSPSRWCTYLLVLGLTLSVLSPADGAVDRTKGVPPEEHSAYNADKFQCRDGSKTIASSRVNDDYCDCDDGSDEPGTSACPNGKFWCENKGHHSKFLYSSRVNDGFCDCCDGSDEFTGVTTCTDRCDEEGAERRRQLIEQIELHEQGLLKVPDYVDAAERYRTGVEARNKELVAQVRRNDMHANTGREQMRVKECGRLGVVNWRTPNWLQVLSDADGAYDLSFFSSRFLVRPLPTPPLRSPSLPLSIDLSSWQVAEKQAEIDLKKARQKELQEVRGEESERGARGVQADRQGDREGGREGLIVLEGDENSQEQRKQDRKSAVRAERRKKREERRRKKLAAAGAGGDTGAVRALSLSLSLSLLLSLSLSFARSLSLSFSLSFSLPLLRSRSRSLVRSFSHSPLARSLATFTRVLSSSSSINPPSGHRRRHSGERREERGERREERGGKGAGTDTVLLLSV